MEERFEILERVGHGGMGTIYRATDRRTNRVVALKIIHPHLVQEQEFVNRFLSETRIATSLEHPNVIPVYDIGRIDQGPYIAMMLVAGESLHDRIKKRGPLKPVQAVEVITQIAAALDYAHSQDIIHRDVKPANVLIDSRTNHAYLTDFGIARALEADTRITRTGAVMGALNYMAPEQFEDGPLDARVDVYSLGCVLFEALSGVLPYRASSEASLIREKLMAEPKMLSDVLPDTNHRLSEVVAKSLARHPEDRFSSAGEFAEAARSALALAPRAGGDHSITAKTLPLEISSSPTIEAPTRLVKSERRSRRIIILGSFLVGLLMLSALAYGGSQLLGGSETKLGGTSVSRQSSSDTTRSTESDEGVTSLAAEEPLQETELEPVTRAYFQAKVPAGWEPGDVDRRNSARLTNTWINPEFPGVSVLIDTLIRASDADPMINAKYVRSFKRKVPGYRDIYMERTRLAGAPAVEWKFHVPSEGTKVDFFFGECNVDVAVLGTAPPKDFDDFYPLFRKVAASVEPRCQKMSLDEPITTDGIGPIRVGMTAEEVEFAAGIDLDATSYIVGECQYLNSDDLPDVHLMFVSGVLERIEVRNKRMRTLSGVRVGDPEEKVIDTYEDRLELEPGFYDPANWLTMIYVPENPKDKSRMVFDSFRGEVDTIRVGRLPAVFWVEGCA